MLPLITRVTDCHVRSPFFTDDTGDTWQRLRKRDGIEEVDVMQHDASNI